MKWMLKGAAVLAILVAAVWGLGAATPAEHTATVERRVDGAPADVWAALTDVEAFPSWRPEVRSVESLPERSGMPSWRETWSSGTLTFEVVEAEAPRRLTTRIADEDAPFGGTWSWALDPDRAGTRVTITEDGVIHSPLFRFVSRFVTGYDATMNGYLDALEARMAAGRDGS